MPLDTHCYYITQKVIIPSQIRNKAVR